MNSFQLHELETAVALVLLSPRLRVSQTAGRSGHRTRQESRERRDDNNTGDHCLRRRPLRFRSRQRFVRIGRPTHAGLRRFRHSVLRATLTYQSHFDHGRRDAPPGTAVSRLGDESATSYTKEW